MAKIISFELEDDTLEEVDKIAARLERSRSYIIRKAVDKYVKEISRESERVLEKLSV